MATIKRKPVTPRMEDIFLADLEDPFGNPLLNKQMLDKLSTVAADRGISLRTIKDLADWLTSEDFDVTDVKIGGTYIFSQAESDLLLCIAYFHPSTEKHPMHERIQELTGDNPFTPAAEATVTTVTVKPVKEDSIAEGFKAFFRAVGKVFTEGG